MPVPSPEPTRPFKLESASVPCVTESVRSHAGSSGPASGSSIAMPSPEAAEKNQRLTGRQTQGLGRCLQGGPPQRRDLRGVALGVGGRGGDDGQAGRRRERDVEDRLALAVGRHLQRSQVVLGLPRTLGRIAGTGEDVDAEGRVRRAAAQPALELAVRRR